MLMQIYECLHFKRMKITRSGQSELLRCGFVSRKSMYVFPLIYEPRHEKINNVGFIQVRHKQSSTRTEDCQRLETLEKTEELYYPFSENKGVDQLRSYCEADLRLCFRICKMFVFSCCGSYVSC